MRDTIPFMGTIHTILEGYEISLQMDEGYEQSQLFHANAARFGSKNGQVKISQKESIKKEATIFKGDGTRSPLFCKPPRTQTIIVLSSLKVTS